MNHSASFSTTLTTQPAQSAEAKRAIALWCLAAAFIVIAVAVVVADASMVPEQRIALFIHSGMFP